MSHNDIHPSSSSQRRKQVSWKYPIQFNDQIFAISKYIRRRHFRVGGWYFFCGWSTNGRRWMNELMAGNGNTFVYEYKTVKWKILLAQNEICIINNDDDVSGNGQIELGLTQFLFPFQSPSRIFGTSRSFRGRYWNESTNAEIKVVLVSQLNSHPIQRNPIADSFGMDGLEKSE